MPVFFAKEQHVLIQLETDDDWQSFFQNCEGYITPRDYGLIQDYLKDIAKTIVLEKGYVDADYRDTYFNFFSHKFAQYPSKTNRVTPIGRTILDPSKLPFVSGHVCTSEYLVHILGAELTAKGFPYMSQDTDVTVCPCRLLDDLSIFQPALHPIRRKVAI
jgi:hypothetical protein